MRLTRFLLFSLSLITLINFRLDWKDVANYRHHAYSSSILSLLFDLVDG